MTRLKAFRPRPAHASLVVSVVVALKSFQMSFAALHDLSVRNLVDPTLASNVPLAIDGLVVGSIIATASFRKRSMGWWYSTALFLFWTLISVAGNVEYAREIGGDMVSVAIYAGMPMTMLFSVHLTLMLWQRGRVVAAEAAAALAITEEPVQEWVEEPIEPITEDVLESVRATEPLALAQPKMHPFDAFAARSSAGAGLNSQQRINSFELSDRGAVASTGARS